MNEKVTDAAYQQRRRQRHMEAVTQWVYFYVGGLAGGLVMAAFQEFRLGFMLWMLLGLCLIALISAWRQPEE